MERAAARSEQSPSHAPEGALPDAETLGRAIAPASPRHRSVQQLHALLVGCRPGGDAAERVESLEKLARWLQSGRGVVTTPAALPGDGPAVQRLRLVIAALEAAPPFAQRVAFTLARVLEDSVGGGLFGRLGLPTDRGFFP